MTTRTVAKTHFLTGARSFERVRMDTLPLQDIIARQMHRQRFKAGGGGGGYTAQQNSDAEAAVLAIAQPMIQQVSQSSFAAANSAQGQILNIPLNNVGLNTKITVEVSGTFVRSNAEQQNKTEFGVANFFSNVQLTDLSNYQRINTQGWHLHLLATLRRQMAFGAAFVNDSPMNFGSTWPVCNQPPAVGAVAQNFRFFFELPIAYHDADLRGAIYAAVTNATWRLQLTINPNFSIGSAGDGTFACYKSTTAGDLGTLTNVVVTVYQHYLDQLPRSGNMPVVPLISLAYNYLIQNTTTNTPVANADFPIQYANFRTFLSTIAVYDNAGVLNIGTDMNYVGIQVANLTFLEKLDPFMATLKTRQLIGDDPPRGTYIFDHRRKPIVTDQYGNMQFVANPSAVTAGAFFAIGYEMLSIQSQAINAGSLAAR